MQEINEYYQIKDEYLNTGVYKIYLKSRYTTIIFNTNKIYKQTKLKRLYLYKELHKYIEQVYKTEDERIKYMEDILADFDNVILISDETFKPLDNTKEENIKVLTKDTKVDYNEYSLKELRAMFPDIKSNSKEKFIKQIV